ncbi:peptidylprolyl isomerase [Halocynthiibacter sp. C4]|uniref:peptidylprolyl isomerase n=1 Tax=Halocynthiibacter sp. C4 TaxID=2992758 RepID=UPI00237B8D22|nr:peptidylprolyl isomerase [Halocynthiibacter sp. C4]MDE0589353.1 peptidylprolyl isomerase [Halocynthiibacter sp. C4]
MRARRFFAHLAVMASLGLAALSGTTNQTLAESPFDPVIYVNDEVITRYEVEQRQKFLKVLGNAGDLQKAAQDRLIEESLYRLAGRRYGIEPTQEEIEEGMAEFAARAELEPQEFIMELEKEEIDASTFRDFVTAGIIWRNVVGGRFGARATVTEAEIDRALSLSSNTGGIRVLLSEIILPADTPENAERAADLAKEIALITSEKSFSAAAAQVSVSPSRENGGQLDWLNLSNLPPTIRPILLTMTPGEITDPIELPDAIAIFQLRGLQETGPVIESEVAVEYARLYVPLSSPEKEIIAARNIRETNDTCEDLYGTYGDLPVENFEIISQASRDVPADIARELALLDEGETSSRLRRNNGQTMVVLMLCGRTAALPEDADREAIRASLFNQRLSSYASGYLGELRANSQIRYP